MNMNIVKVQSITRTLSQTQGRGKKSTNNSTGLLWYICSTLQPQINNDKFRRRHSLFNYAYFPFYKYSGIHDLDHVNILFILITNHHLRSKYIFLFQQLPSKSNLSSTKKEHIFNSPSSTVNWQCLSL